jgi:hypothetical protein
MGQCNFDVQRLGHGNQRGAEDVSSAVRTFLYRAYILATLMGNHPPAPGRKQRTIGLPSMK